MRTADNLTTFACQWAHEDGKAPIISGQLSRNSLPLNLLEPSGLFLVCNGIALYLAYLMSNIANINTNFFPSLPLPGRITTFRKLTAQML